MKSIRRKSKAYREVKLEYDRIYSELLQAYEESKQLFKKYPITVLFRSAYRENNKKIDKLQVEWQLIMTLWNKVMYAEHLDAIESLEVDFKDHYPEIYNLNRELRS